MHLKEKEAIELLEKYDLSEINEKVNSKDLLTIVRCLGDESFYQECKYNLNKNDLTDFTPKEAFEEYHIFPKWFEIFCPRNVQTLLFMFGSQLEVSEEYLEDIIDEQSYLNDLVTYGVFSKKIKFRSKVYKQDSIEKFLEHVNESIEILENIVLEEENIYKFKYFKCDDFIEPNLYEFKNSLKRLGNIYESYKEVFHYFDLKSDEEDKLFSERMPNEMELKGTFLLESNLIRYSLEQDPLNFFIDELKVLAYEVEKFNKEKFSKNVRMFFNMSKIGAAITIPNPASIVSAGYAIKNSLENIDLFQDSVELSKDMAEIVFHEKRVLVSLYNEYLKQDLNFELFFKEKIRNLISYTISKEINMKISINNDLLDNIFDNFMESIVDPQMPSLNNVLENQMDLVEDLSGFKISLICDTMSSLGDNYENLGF